MEFILVKIMRVVLCILFCIVKVQTQFSNAKCKPENGQIEGLKGLYERIERVSLKVVAKPCFGMKDFYYKWELFDPVVREVLMRGNKQTFEFSGYSIPFPRVFTNLYKVIATVSHYPSLENTMIVNGLLSFKASVPFLKIVGDELRVHPSYTDLHLDAESQSYDTSFAPGESPFTDNEINWKCNNFDVISVGLHLYISSNQLKPKSSVICTVKMKRTKIANDVVEVSYTQTIKIRNPRFSLECLKNCGKPHAMERTVVKVNCTSLCNGLYYNWKIQPEVEEEHMVLKEDDKILVVNPLTFTPGKVYNISVTAGGVSKHLVLKIMKIDENANCSVTPKAGISGVTRFCVKCLHYYKSWLSKLVVIQLYAKCEHSYLKQITLISQGEWNDKNCFYLNEDDAATVVIKITELFFVKYRIEIKVKVFPFRLPVKTTERALREVVLGNSRRSFKSHMKQLKSADGISQAINFILSPIQTIKDDLVKRELYKHIAITLRDVKVKTLNEVIQILGVMYRFMHFNSVNDSRIFRIIGETTYRLSDLMLNYTEILIREQGIDLPSLIVEENLNFFYMIFDILLEKDDDALMYASRVHFYGITSPHYLMDKKYVEFEENYGNITSNLMKTMKNVGSLLLIPKLFPFTIFSEGSDFVFFMSKSVRTNSLYGYPLTFPLDTNSSVIITDDVLDELDQNYPKIRYHLGILEKDIFWWIPIAGYRSCAIIFNILNKDNLLLPTEGSILTQFSEFPSPFATIVGYVDGYVTMRMYRLALQPNSLLVATFDTTHESYIATVSRCACNYKDLVQGIVISSEFPMSYKKLQYSIGENVQNVYVCIMSKTQSRTTYEVKLHSFKCTYWNTSGNMLDSTKCKVSSVYINSYGITEDMAEVNCECNHTSTYVAFAIAPTYVENIIYNTDFLLKPKFNWISTAVVVVIWLIWILLFIWAYFKDKKLKRENIVCILDDNIPGDSYIYLVVIFTGYFLDAGTTANVAFQLVGDKASSRVHLIKCRCVKLLKRNSQDWLIVYTPLELGTIFKIRIWHDCKGHSPHWYCERIIVQELKTGVQYCFLVEKWLSLIWGRGNAYRELYLESDSQCVQYFKQFLTRCNRSTKENSLCVSIFLSDSQSPFSTKQRVACIISSLLLSVIILVMLDENLNKSPTQAIDLRNEFKFTSTELKILFITLLISFIISTAIMICFRHSNPYNPKLENIIDRILGIKYRFMKRKHVNAFAEVKKKRKKKKHIQAYKGYRH